MTIARAQMNRQLYGIGNLVEREKYGIGSKLKKFVRNIIPNEVASVASAAAPFVAPFNPLLAAGMAGLGNFDRTGSISGGLKAAALTYGGGQLARGIGGAGFQTGFNPFDAASLGQSASSFIGVPYSSPIGTATTGLGQFLNPQAARVSQLGPETANLQSFFETVKVPTSISTSAPGTLDQLKTIFDPTSGVDFGTRAQTAMSLTGDAIKSIYTIPDGKGGTTIDKKAVIATLSAIPSYLDAKKKADQIGLSSNEFNEQIYNQEKSMYQSMYQSRLPMESFGIRTTAQMGGIMNGFQQQQEEPIFPRLENLSENLGQAEQTLGQPSNQSNNSPMTSLMMGPQGFAEGGLLSIKLTPREGYFLGDLVSGSGVAVPVSGGQNINRSGGGLGGMLSKLIQQNPQMFKPQSTSSSTSSMSDFIDIDPRDGIDDRSQRANGGRMDYAMGSEIPIRQNQQGTSELDLRAKGGYIPVGIKEKADDVPAMLSKNEFVFTADAVRGAGNGSINKGAQKMYKLMKSLEKKVKKTKVA